MAGLFMMPDLSNFELGIIVFDAIFLIPFSVLNLPFLGAEGGLLSYSKFAHEINWIPKIPAKVSMVTLYLPACLYALLKMMEGDTGGRASLVSTMAFVHFSKRIAECLFLHKYSGTNTLTFTVVGFPIYVIWTYVAITYASLVPKTMLQDWMRSVGLLLFGIGLLGNFYHHYLLANLRKPGEKGYKLPQGGLFSLVSCPHYFFELVGWLGVVIVSQNAMLFANQASMCGYLGDRATQQTKWNLKKFSNYPKDRKHLIPFIF